jgi:hypothetical protein
MADKQDNNQNQEGERSEGNREQSAGAPPIAGFVTANHDLQIEEGKKFEKLAKKQREEFERQQAAEAEEEEKAQAEQTQDPIEEPDTDTQASTTSTSNKDDNTEEAQPLDAAVPETLVDDAPEEEVEAADNTSNADSDKAEEELDFEDDMSEEEKQRYINDAEAARKAAENEANSQDEATNGQMMTVSQALRQLYGIPYTTPAFEQRAKEHHYELLGYHLDPDEETRPMNVGIKLSETFANVSKGRAIVDSEMI